jgi:hypothetical protein
VRDEEREGERVIGMHTAQQSTAQHREDLTERKKRKRNLLSNQMCDVS